MLKRLVVLTAMVSLTVGVTAAYFSDTDTSENNTITAGTLKFGNPVNATWTASDLAPGDSEDGSFDLTNVGSIDADHLEITTANSSTGGNLWKVLEVDEMIYGPDSDDDGDVSDESTGATVDIISVITSGSSAAGGGTPADQDDDYALVLETAVDGSTDVAQLDANNDDVVTLEELAAGTIEISASSEDAGLKAGADAGFYAKLTVSTGAGNEYQGADSTHTWTYTLNQDSSQ